VAARKLGWEKIPAVILKGIDAVEAELVEIDENLIRADLTPAEQAAHHARRKVLHEQKHPETKRTATLKRGNQKAPSRQNGETKNRYTKDTAEKTGDSERTIQRHVERGNSIPNVSELAGTSLDQGAELDALAKLKDIAPERQAELIEQAKEGEKVSAKAEVKKASNKPKPPVVRAFVPMAERFPVYVAAMRENINAIIKTATNPNADFAKMAASTGPAQRAAALAEAEKGLDALQKWRQAINQTIESAAVDEEENRLRQPQLDDGGGAP
jgi:hypothetical protein